MSKYIDAEAFREEMDNDFPFDKYTQDHEPLLNLAKSRIIRLLAKRERTQKKRYWIAL